MSEINTWPTQGWRCVRLLGEGSFGKVYEISRTEFGQEYRAALKVITVPQSRADLDNAYSVCLNEKSVTTYFREIVEDISGEVALMSQLKGHSNIVSYEDHMVLEHPGVVSWDILIRMELLTPLHAWCAGRTLTQEEVIRLGCDLCRALELCQRKNIIHRDIKPENIFINEFGDFKLGDFGIARTVERTMSNLSKKGTYTYMAPEVYLGKAYNQTVDIYSLGVVLYRYLNENRTPFLPQGALRYRDREDAQRRRMAGETVPPPCHGNYRLQRVVLKALAYDPKERYQTAGAFRAALEGCQPQPGVEMTPDSESATKEIPQENAAQCKTMDANAGRHLLEQEEPEIAGAMASKPGEWMSESIRKEKLLYRLYSARTRVVAVLLVVAILSVSVGFVINLVTEPASPAATGALPEESAGLYPSSIVLNTNSITLEPDGSTILTASLDIDISEWDGQIIWISGAEEVATVDSMGPQTARITWSGEGLCVITAYIDGSYSATGDKLYANCAVSCNAKNAQDEWTEWTEWSEWSFSPAHESSTREVETRTVWGYYYYLCQNCGAHMPYHGAAEQYHCMVDKGGCGAEITDEVGYELWSTTSWEEANLQWFAYNKYYTTFDGEVWFQWNNEEGEPKTQYRYRDIIS